MAIPVDPTENKKFEEVMAKVKCIILDGVKDHVVQHIAKKEMTKEMWDALKKLYEHTSVQRKMLLENQLCSYQMQKGEQKDHFLELWATLHQVEIRGLSKTRSSSKGVRIKKEEEEDATLASVGKQEKRKKKDLSKVKCFNCGELGHYVNQCLKKKSKGEASDSMAAPMKAEKEVEEDDDCAMSAHVPLEKRWGEIEL
eukprot:PITA_02280